jgi:hypothetical protein
MSAVFVATNHNNTTAPTEPANQVVMYDRARDGSLTETGRFDTGGQGSGPAVRFAGDGLGSSHSVELTQNRRFLLVTNAGSDDVSVFRVTRTGLTLTDREPTGDFPNSVTTRGSSVVVLKRVRGREHQRVPAGPARELTPVAGSTRALGREPGPGPAGRAVQPDAGVVHAERAATGRDDQGRPAGRVARSRSSPPRPARAGCSCSASAARGAVGDVRPTDLENDGPFGFSFDRRGTC